MERQIEHKKSSGSFWAYVLIIVGVLWLLQKSGWNINLPGFGDFFAGIGSFFGNLFHLSAAAVLPMLIIFFGLKRYNFRALSFERKCHFLQNRLKFWKK